MPIIDKIVRCWQKHGQQTNAIRILVAAAFKNDLAKSELARILRNKLFSKTDPWDGRACEDAQFNRIYCTLVRIEIAWKKGELNLLLVLFVLLNNLQRQ